LEVFLTLFDEVKKSYYETLGIPKNAQAPEIKRAYFGLVRKYPPDRFPEEFKEIRAAYEVLSDQEKRAKYDAVGELPASVAPFFYEAQRLDRFGRYGKAEELYRTILKLHPELDNVREQYAWTLLADDKTGKAIEVWEELCRRNPGNSHYARELTRTYIDRGWHKKAFTEIRRAIAMDRRSIDNWSVLITCNMLSFLTHPDWEESYTLCLEALEAVKDVKIEEWKKIHLYTYAFITSGIKKKGEGREHLKELLRLTRESGREGREEGKEALEEIVKFLPTQGLAVFYDDLKELAALFSDTDDNLALIKLDDARLIAESNALVQKGFHEIFRDLFRMIIDDVGGEEEELEILAIECILLNKRDQFAPQIRRLKAEFPELYEFYDSFFDEVLRTRNPEKLLFQRSKKLSGLKRKYGIFDKESGLEPESQPIRRDQPKVGRNDPCPCGSGKKYKRCCGA
jgi:tetratricopeptide (TPR) repeat protein